MKLFIFFLIVFPFVWAIIGVLRYEKVLERSLELKKEVDFLLEWEEKTTEPRAKAIFYLKHSLLMDENTNQLLYSHAKEYLEDEKAFKQKYFLMYLLLGPLL